MIGKPGPPVHHEVNIEGDADAEQQRQRDDIGVVELHADHDHDAEGHQRGEQQGREN